MINVDSISNSLFLTLASDTTLVNSGFNVVLGEPLNSDPHLFPWVGVYADNIDILPLTVGGATPWTSEIFLTIVVQEGSMLSGQDANERLYRALFPVLSAVNSNKTLDSTVQMIEQISIEPFDRNLEDENWFYSQAITIQARQQV